MQTTTERSIFLTAAGVSAVFAIPDGGLPRIIHWGRAVPEGDAIREGLVWTSNPAVLNSSFDTPRNVSIAPTGFQGWSGTPGLAYHSDGAAGAVLTLEDASSDGTSATFALRDPDLGITIECSYELLDSGILRARTSVNNPPEGPTARLDIAALRVLMPVPQRASEILDFTGRWSGERRPQRSAVTDGTRLRASRRGRPGHDAPFVSVLGTPGFSFRGGEVWASHIAWSGNQEQITERLPEGAGTLTTLIGGGELLEPGEISLAPGSSYSSPEVLFAWSDEGTDGVARRFHNYARSLPSHPASDRPLVLNTWEAVYFDHDLDRLSDLATQAASLGVERFVLDDGWFRGRRDDTAGLGDWFVDAQVWPEGLSKLSNHVHGLGMEFGLWFEPEMVNLDSDLARRHPHWILGDPRAALGWRNQHVLNVAEEDAWQYLLGRMDELVAKYEIDFIKWDHNRDLHGATDRSTGSFNVHAQTTAVYRLMDALRSKHPALEIESCASGGARIDLGILSHTQRVWPSDTNDPHERQMIQQWTGLLLPPELIGSHVGPAEAHTTHRTTTLPFRLATALFGHAGIEWDITSCSAEELSAIRSWADLYKELRPLLHAGTTVHADGTDAGTSMTGVVSADQAHAVFAWTRTETSSTAHSPRVRLPGLDVSTDYQLRVRDEIGAASRHLIQDPAWFPANRATVRLPGLLLTEIGVPLPTLNPGNTILIEVTAASD
ncbi:alpha-galactosidase [Arthrobacter sp. NPDC058127]|uniref:alpha-galactosidase n=1 Tax=Arthrobacter sp. NPDC058127 TaxID=3346351 RepID=UPI0036E2B493